VFVEDRVDTLLEVKASPIAEQTDLLLADWGYNTAAQRRLAADNGIRVCSQDELAKAFAECAEASGR
jgi:hypothetical protein